MRSKVMMVLKNIRVVLIVGAALVLSGCVSSPVPQEAPATVAKEATNPNGTVAKEPLTEQENSPTPSPQDKSEGTEKSNDSLVSEKLYKVGEVVPLGGGVTAKVVETRVIPDKYADEGAVFGVHILMKNGSKERVSMGNTFNWKLISKDGSTIDSAYFASADEKKTPQLSEREARPGAEARGWLFFESAKRPSGAILQFDNWGVSRDISLD